MRFPYTPVLTAVGLGAVGAVIAAGAALSTTSDVRQRSDDQPTVAAPATSAPCPPGTTDTGTDCVRVVVTEVPRPAVPHRSVHTTTPRAVPPATTQDQAAPTAPQPPRETRAAEPQPPEVHQSEQPDPAESEGPESDG